MNQNRGITCKKVKKTKKESKLGFLGNGMHVHAEASMRRTAACVHTLTYSRMWDAYMRKLAQKP